MTHALDALLRESAKTWPKRPALIDESGAELSYSALNGLADRAARFFKESGLKAGDRAAFFSRNDFDSTAALFGLWRAGGTAVWLNHSLGKPELEAALSDSEASFLVYEENLRERAEALQSASTAKYSTKRMLLGREPSPIQSSAGPEDLAAIVYTSGSTDKPLGVMLTHRNLLANNQAIAEYLRLGENDRVCCVLPFYYIYGLSLLLSHTLVGGAVILENRFSFPQIALDAMETLKATGFSGVSSHYLILINHTDFLKRRLPRLRYFTQAGDKMPPAATEKILKNFPDKELYLMYGQTEAAPRISYLDPRSAAVKPASAGRPLKNIELRIVGEDGASCAPGQEGEIAIRGDNVMKGYWKRPQETAKVLREGWLFTGDIGYRDADGDLFVTGRNKQFIKVGGRRVSPAEVEAAALEFPGVREAAVIGIPDALLGEKLRLYVAGNGDALDAHGLTALYKKKMPFYKVPSEIVRLESLPRNSQGKIDRRILAQEAARADA